METTRLRSATVYNTALWNLQVDVFDDFLEKGFRLEKLRGLAFEVLKYFVRTNSA